MIQQKENDIVNLNEKIGELRQLTSARNAALDDQKTRFEELEFKITSLRFQITGLERARDQLKAKINDKNCEIEDAEAQMKALDDVILIKSQSNYLITFLMYFFAL